MRFWRWLIRFLRMDFAEQARQEVALEEMQAAHRATSLTFLNGDH
jgi:hypothetical protein